VCMSEKTFWLTKARAAGFHQFEVASFERATFARPMPSARAPGVMLSDWAPLVP
jgi:hypothetical protein